MQHLSLLVLLFALYAVIDFLKFCDKQFFVVFSIYMAVFLLLGQYSE